MKQNLKLLIILRILLLIIFILMKLAPNGWLNDFSWWWILIPDWAGLIILSWIAIVYIIYNRKL